MINVFHIKILIIHLTLLTVLTINNDQFISVALQDNQEQQQSKIRYEIINEDFSQLITYNKPQNYYLQKNISLSVGQKLKYQSSVLTPIFLVQKQQCHSHQGYLEVNKLEDIHYGESNMITMNNQTNQEIQTQQQQSLNNDNKQILVYNQKYKIIYKLTPSKLKVKAYLINQNNLQNKLQRQNIPPSGNNINQDIINQINKQNRFKNDKIVKHIAEISLSELFNDQTQQTNNRLSCLLSTQYTGAQMILSKNNQFLYVFTCREVYMIYCSTVLAKSSLVFTFIEQNQQILSTSMQKKVFYGIQLKTVNEYIFWLSQKQGLRIYGIGVNGGLQYIQTLNAPHLQNKQSIKNTQFKQTTLNNNNQALLTSISYHNGYLYILTLHYGIHVFQRQTSFSFKYVHYIDYLPQIQNKINKQIIVIENTILIWTQARRWQFIAEINVNEMMISSSSSNNNNNNNLQANKQSKPLSDIYSLNRYFKGYRQIQQIQLLQRSQLVSLSSNQDNQANKPTQQSKKHTQQIPQINQSSQNQYYLMIVSDKGLQLFPIGIDARQIKSNSNGVINNHIGSQIESMIYISQGVFISQEVSYVNQQSLYRSSSSYPNDNDLINEDNKLSQNHDDQNSNNYDYATRQKNTLIYMMQVQVRYPFIQCQFDKQGEYTIFVQQQAIKDSIYLINKGNKDEENKNNHNKIKTNKLNQLNKQRIQKNNHHSSSSNLSSSHFYHQLHIVVQKQPYLESISLLISFVTISVLLLIMALLIFWRSSKQSIIDSIIEQIRIIKMRNMKQVQFQELSPQKQARQRKWEELQEQIENQLSYKVERQHIEEGEEEREGGDNNLMSERNFYHEQTSQKQRSKQINTCQKKEITHNNYNNQQAQNKQANTHHTPSSKTIYHLQKQQVQKITQINLSTPSKSINQQKLVQEQEQQQQYQAAIQIQQKQHYQQHTDQQKEGNYQLALLQGSFNMQKQVHTSVLQQQKYDVEMEQQVNNSQLY